ncbi:hypothetical protein [Streptosporangium sandarakinum]
MSKTHWQKTKIDSASAMVGPDSRSVIRSPPAIGPTRGNAKAKRELGRRPAHPSWRQGLGTQ